MRKFIPYLIISLFPIFLWGQAINEKFEDVSTLEDKGWQMINLSQPLGPLSWFQGNLAVFDSHEESTNAYIAVNYNSTVEGGGTIDNWLITPTVYLKDGDKFSFWTRTTDRNHIYQDRLHVRVSKGELTLPHFNPSGNANGGSFSTTSIIINGGLNSKYPDYWSKYEITISDVGNTPVPMNFAFRYWVTKGGAQGPNSNYIGIDTVQSGGCADFQLEQSEAESCDAPYTELTASSHYDQSYQYKWFPYTGLFTNPGLTNQYTGGYASTLYTAATSDQIYTVTASNSNECSIEKDIEARTLRNVWEGSALGSSNNNRDWFRFQNWSKKTVPTAEDCVFIPRGKAPAEIAIGFNMYDGKAYAKNIEVQAGGQGPLSQPGAQIKIKSGASLTVTDYIRHEGLAKDFVVEHNANLVQINDAADNEINEIKVEKTFVFSGNDGTTTGGNPDLQFNFVTSPVDGQNILNIFNPASGLAQEYNENTNYFTTSTGEYVFGKGFALREPESSAGNPGPGTATFIGKPYNGDSEVIELERTSGGGFNLIGNPYPSNIDLQKVYNNNSSLIEPSFFFWDNRGNTEFTMQGSNYNGDHYAKFNAATGGLGGGTGVSAPSVTGETKKPNRYVTIGTGFMVQAKTNGNLRLNNSYRTVDSGVNFLGKGNFAPQDDRYWLIMSTPGNIDVMTAITYFEGGDDAFAIDDTEGFGGSDELFTLVDNHQLVIQGKAPFKNTDVVPLGYRAFVPGFYTISIEDSEGVFANGQKIYLRDKLAGVVHTLTDQDYVFKTVNGQYTDRFELFYKRSHKASENQASLSNVTISRKDHNIDIASTEDKIVNVEIYDLNGVLVYHKNNIHSHEFKIPNFHFTKQFLVVVVKTETGEIVNRKLINN